jgi:hypothetical protein
MAAFFHMVATPDGSFAPSRRQVESAGKLRLRHRMQSSSHAMKQRSVFGQSCGDCRRQMTDTLILIVAVPLPV